MMKLSEKMERLGTETAFKVMVQAQVLEAEGMDVVHDVVHLEIGEHDFITPKNICAAASEALPKW